MKKESIFQNAYFGKPYKTRDERKFIFLGIINPIFGEGKAIEGMIDGDDLFTYYNTEGKPLYCEFGGSAKNASYIDFKQVLTDCEYLDIVSEWSDEHDDGIHHVTLDNCVYNRIIGYIRKMDTDKEKSAEGEEANINSEVSLNAQERIKMETEKRNQLIKETTGKIADLQHVLLEEIVNEEGNVQNKGELIALAGITANCKNMLAALCQFSNWYIDTNQKLDDVK